MKSHIFEERVCGFNLAIATPRRLLPANKLLGQVVILDIAFGNKGGSKSYPSITHKLIDELGSRLAVYLDHHDSVFHKDFADDPRFYLASKSVHGACPEMITPEIVAAAGSVDTILCHNDFDGLASAAKWMSDGVEPYEGCDHDAWCIDTRLETPSIKAQQIDLALRAQPKDLEIKRLVVELFMRKLDWPEGWKVIHRAEEISRQREMNSARLAESYRSLTDYIVFVDTTHCEYEYDRTTLLLLGQQKAKISVMRVKDSVTFATAFNNKINFLKIFGLSGGMPTVASISLKRLPKALATLGVARLTIVQLLDDLDLQHLI